jgi:predicted DNA-binding protein (MmcQ/YjbR family)
MSSQDVKNTKATAATKASPKTGTRAKGRESAHAAATEAVRRHALSYPETHEDFPWGDRALKVRGKVFVFMGTGPDELSLSVKLPQSRDIALMLPFATPTGYGLGKSGWVSARFPADASPPVDMLLDWIDESYRAIAPKKLIAQIGAPGTAGTAAAPAKKTAAKTAKAGAPAKKAAKTAKAAAPAKKKAVKATGKATKAANNA